MIIISAKYKQTSTASGHNVSKYLHIALTAQKWKRKQNPFTYGTYKPFL